MLRMLDELCAKLTRTEQQLREQCFERARRMIRQSASAGGIKAVFVHSWRNPKVRGGVRVDLEVRGGLAAVLDPAPAPAPKE
jgi:hypothetical protein